MDNLPHISAVPETENEWFGALAALSRFLRSPQGCPWDQKQSAIRFAEYAKEELDELLEALREGDNPHAEEEYGDVFFVLLAAAAAAEAEGRFSLKNALARAHEKMVRRHDHVFRSDKATTPEEAIEAWNKIKEQERAARSAE